MARTDQPHKLTFEAFVAKASDLSDPVNVKHAGLDYSRPETCEGWNGRQTKVRIWCRNHNEFFTQHAGNHLSGQGCPKCGAALRTAKKTKGDPLADFRRVHGDTYDYARVAYVNSHTPVDVICREHGAFPVRPNAHLRGSGCPTCWQNRRKAFGAARNTTFRDVFAERAARVHGGAYAVLSAPEHAHDTVALHCPRHGPFSQKAYSHLDGHGCPACGKVTSYAQRDLAAFVEGLGVAVEHDNSTVLGGLHIDIWVPGRALGIEYHGQHWHTEARVGNKHREKWERAERAGVRLIQVFDFEWLGNRAAVENRLRAILGGGPVYSARRCEVSEINRATATAFLKQWHSQGAGARGEVFFGLVQGGELLACAAFGQSRFKRGEPWEVLRYASIGRVRGGFSRLFRAFCRTHKPTGVVSYCDLRWGDGRVYSASGFTLDGVTAPDYWYADGERCVSRYTAQHRPMGQTEREWASAHGYAKVLGVGHQRWVWRPA